MDHRTRKYIEKLLCDYPYLDGYIAQRRRDLLHPHRETDSNIGGSSSGRIGDGTEAKALALATDRRIRRLEEIKAAMDKVLDALDPNARKVIELRFWQSPPKSWIAIAYQCGYSERQCYNIRDRVCEELGRELGMVD